mgnify:CR=1 FL=1
MSGIVALFGRGQESIARGDFRTMLDRIDHRGPDGRGTWDDAYVSLGHQQLQSTPESRFDSQPRRDGDVTVTADVRLDNRDELIDRLSIADPADRVPDSRLVSSAYRRWGVDCVEHLVGAFAFIVWDDDAERLFCARDHMGVKPFYYHTADDLFAASSEIKSLVGLPSVSRTLDHGRLGDFLVGRFGDKENTIYESVRRLPPGHRMTVDFTDTSIERYWDPEPHSLDLRSDAAYERRFRELFTEAVRCRLRGRGLVGTELSGGLDSSSVTAVAREQLPDDEPLHTFSNVFDEADRSDEREFIEVLGKRDGIYPHLVHTDVGALVDVDDLLFHFDQPLHHPAHFAGWMRAKRADQTGVDTLLTGTTGDASVGYGLDVLVELLRTGRWLRLYRELEAMSELWGQPRRTLFVEHCLKPLFPDPLLRRYQQFNGKPILEERANPALDQAFVERTGLRSRYRRLYASRWQPLTDGREKHYQSIMLGMLTEALEVYDHRDAAFGIDSRHPFTDKRLVEFLISLPSTQQFSDGWPRSIVRRSLGDVLPEKLRTRLWKITMDDAVHNALTKENPMFRRMLNHPGQLPEYLDTESLRSMYERFRNGASSSNEEGILWRALSLHVWLENVAPRPAERGPSRV